MKDLAPEITHQGLIIKGRYRIKINETVVESYIKSFIRVP